MATVYEMTMFLCIGLLAVVVAVFVLAASLLGRAIDEARKEQSRIAEAEQEDVDEAIAKIRTQIGQTTASKEDLDRLRAGLSEYVKRSEKLRREAKRAASRYGLLTAKGSVLLPAMTFLFALVLAGAARWWVGLSYAPWGGQLLWATSLLLLCWGCVRVYRSLQVIEKLAISTDEAQDKRMGDALEAALRRREEAERPKLVLKFEGKQPPFKFTHDTEETIACGIFLGQGDVANGAEFWFAAPRAFAFPGMETFPADRWVPGAHSVCLRCSVPLKRGLTWVAELRIKAPTSVGKFEAHYRAFCEGFEGGIEKTEIEVV